MTRDQLRGEVRALVGELAEAPDDDAAELRLESFTLVVLAEDLEARFGIRVAARDVVPENFGSIARLTDYVMGKRT